MGEGMEKIDLDQRQSWWTTAAALVALTSVLVQSDSAALPAAAGGLLILSHLVRWRIPANALIGWGLRAAMFAAVIAPAAGEGGRPGPWLPDAQFMHLFASLCAVELVLQYWRRHRRGPARGEAMLLTALILAAGTGTFDRTWVPYLVPLWAIFVAMSLREFQGAMEVRGPEQRPAPMRGWLALGAMLGVVLAIGAATAEGVRIYGQQITFYPMGMPFKRPYTSVGLSDTPRLTASFNTGVPLTRALRIEAAWPGAHLRGIAFDTYAGGAWGPSAETRRLAPVTQRELRGDAPGNRVRVTRLSESFELICAPLNSAGLRLPAEAAARWDVQSRMIRAGVEEAQTYEIIESAQVDHQGSLCGPLDAPGRARCLEIPAEVSPEVVALAQRVAGRGDPRERMAAIEEYLRTHHRYSLTIVPRGNEPVSDFILNQRDGHCQFFASAAVIMLRAVDLPARFVTGFYAHETSGSSTTVRQRDAHAWAECWIDGIGWVTVDATPATGRPDELFGRASVWDRFTEMMHDGAAAIRRFFLKPDPKQIAVAVAAIAALWALPRGWRWWRGRRRRAAVVVDRRGYEPADGELAELAAMFERMLARAGVVISDQRTWREMLAGDAPAGSSLDGAAYSAFLDRYEAARFGQRSGAAAELRGILQRISGDGDGTERSSDGQ